MPIKEIRKAINKKFYGRRISENCSRTRAIRENGTGERGRIREAKSDENEIISGLLYGRELNFQDAAISGIGLSAI